MKRLIISVLAFLFLLCTATLAETDETEEHRSGDYTYVILEDGTAEITKYSRSGNIELDIPSELDGRTVTGIGKNAFEFCNRLTAVTIPGSVTSIGNFAFTGCSRLTDITIPESVTDIGDYAFLWCGDLASITIPESVTSIGDCVFCYCYRLTTITIPDSVTSIGINPFFGCDHDIEIRVSHEHPYLETIDGVLFSKPDRRLVCFPFVRGETEYKYSIPQGTQIIGDAAFYGCGRLISVTIPDSVTIIGNGAFSSCSALATVTIPDGVTSIGDDAFSSCYRLLDITIPSSVVSIGDNAFAECDCLTAVTIPDSVTSIGVNPFRSCEKLKKIHVSPEHPFLETIGGVLFSKPDQQLISYPCGLGNTEYSIPQGTQTIGNDALMAEEH